MAESSNLPPSELGVWLRAQPTLTGAAPPLVVEDLPDDPVPLFLDWLRSATAAGVPEPHAATLATVDEDGLPDARTLILKDVDARGWAFAGARSSRKAAQLGASPAAALNLWWQPQRRAVRVRGSVQEASPAESDADLAARSESARGGLHPGDWVLWRVVPTRIEFWQGSPDRNHTRIVYDRVDGRWQHAITGADLGSSAR
ncbi:pyridoxine/pyridoxamine 5'-phosphate oxidase [Zhihengliuella sp. ISTPL4]|uniref:pyridoxine/pyridoxamine 5'-phosphate oxidase n=1 Tax=Zhihengliuella sp. ISTPL4 TaxID=2058657 RepID=UPI000C7D09AB|nr:pyridoxamine 5'-phosphate oxidase family protein [Zhihengliuella sp. ISTPL4]